MRHPPGLCGRGRRRYRIAGLGMAGPERHSLSSVPHGGGVCPSSDAWMAGAGGVRGETAERRGKPRPTVLGVGMRPGEPGPAELWVEPVP